MSQHYGCVQKVPTRADRGLKIHHCNALAADIFQD